jgi:hypothetical protein
MYVRGKTDFTPMAYGDTGAIPQNVKTTAAASLANAAAMAKEKVDQAKEVLADLGGFSSAADGMKKVFGNFGAKK